MSEFFEVPGRVGWRRPGRKPSAEPLRKVEACSRSPARARPMDARDRLGRRRASRRAGRRGAYALYARYGRGRP